ncbi:DUF86 domain-containing protein [Candidatus Uhrbacteria bacterium]|nr:DUF86 domain-containing protein [Candidatus Uhrbacteria bacterium]
MSSVDQKSVAQKLIRLEEVIRKLEEIARTPEEAFLEDDILQAAAERFFILGIEIITDVGNHLLVEKAGKAGASYKDILIQLGRTKLVSKSLTDRNLQMTGFRNLLIHAYEIVDPRRVYDALQIAPKELRAFAKAFARHLK